MSEQNNGFEKFLDIVGEILAFLTVVLYAVLIINMQWSFIPEGTFFNILLEAKKYAALAVVLVVGLEAVVKRSFIIKLLFFVLLAVIIVFMFFPGTWANLTQLI